MAIDYERDVQPDPEQAEEEARKARKGRAIAGLARTAASVAAHSQGRLLDEMSAASPLGALTEVAESAEQGMSSSEVEERMERFPELRGVEVATGNAARFPELAQPAAPTKEQPVEEDVFNR